MLSDSRSLYLIRQALHHNSDFGCRSLLAHTLFHFILHLHVRWISLFFETLSIFCKHSITVFEVKQCEFSDSSEDWLSVRIWITFPLICRAYWNYFLVEDLLLWVSPRFLCAVFYTKLTLYSKLCDLFMKLNASFKLCKCKTVFYRISFSHFFVCKNR